MIGPFTNDFAGGVIAATVLVIVTAITALLLYVFRDLSGPWHPWRDPREDHPLEPLQDLDDEWRALNLSSDGHKPQRPDQRPGGS